jgi:hypothetical protein
MKKAHIYISIGAVALAWLAWPRKAKAASLSPDKGEPTKVDVYGSVGFGEFTVRQGGKATTIKTDRPFGVGPLYDTGAEGSLYTPRGDVTLAKAPYGLATKQG